MLRTALVTGASAGLGRELVRQLVRDRKMTVLATARRADRLEELVRDLPGGRVQVLAGDLADPGFRERLWLWAEETSGGLDLLVNNAGIGHYAKFATQDPAIVRQIVEVNLMALIDLTQRALRHLKPRGSGQILQIASLLGFMGLPYSTVYVATKHAVIGLVRSLRYELRGSGIRVWAACPGRTESEFYQVALDSDGQPGSSPRAAPTDRVVRTIVRGLDRRCAFLVPDPTGKALAWLSHWLPGPFNWTMERWSADYFAREIAAARTRPPR
ncbi:MAG TPA: SDR family NAD(P)-dependent oxidoreductase [Isosphaeraceae bacterium]|jgi:hypothetical protein|nr:SDR family NAD(P)-dependent oxidoreductase [Isosphaeraceae bacterium]